MDPVGIALCVISAVGFSIWPLLARFSGASNGWVAIMVFIPASIVNVVINRQSLSEIPDKRVLGILAVSGILDIAGLLAFTRMLGGGYSFSGLMTANIIIMVVCTSAGGILILGEPLTRDKVLGYVLGAIAAWLLTKNSGAS